MHGHYWPTTDPHSLLCWWMTSHNSTLVWAPSLLYTKAIIIWLLPKLYPISAYQSYHHPLPKLSSPHFAIFPYQSYHHPISLYFYARDFSVHVIGIPLPCTACSIMPSSLHHSHLTLGSHFTCTHLSPLPNYNTLTTARKWVMGLHKWVSHHSHLTLGSHFTMHTPFTIA